MKKGPRGRRRRDRPRTTDVDSLETAIRLHKSGKLVEAEQAYLHVIEASPHNAHALYLCGVVTAQLGRPSEAIKRLQESVSLEPDYPQAISELAKLYQETGQFHASAEALRKLINIQPELGELYSNLGVVLGRMGKPEEAAVACARAVELSPERAEVHSNMGDVLKSRRRFDEAVAAYRRAIQLKPGLTGVYRNLAAVLRISDRFEEATEVFQQWLKIEPDNPVAQHMLAAHRGERVPGASDDYVRRVFDEFAESFDDDLRALDYQGPQLIGEAVSAELGEGVKELDVLDAGCGTGMCGPLLRSVARRLVGVDLSPVMLQHARALELYDQLVEGELTDYMNGQPQEFDLIVAADTFNYFGALDQLLSSVARALRETGVLLYTLEKSEESASVVDFRLHAHGRYSHNEDYVKRCMKEHGLTVVLIDYVVLRTERSQPVAGFIVRARKQAN